MALNVAPGASDAEAYAEISEIHDYATKHGASFPITTPDEQAKAEAAARRATAWLDGTFRDRFIGQPTNAEQALEWPRTGVAYRGHELPNDQIPRQIIEAMCEAAIRELASPNSLSPDVTKAEQASRTKVKAGPVETERQFAEMKSVSDALPIVTAIDRILAPLLRPASGATVDVLRY